MVNLKPEAALKPFPQECTCESVIFCFDSKPQSKSAHCKGTFTGTTPKWTPAIGGSSLQPAPCTSCTSCRF